jgi:hypothetical protein
MAVGTIGMAVGTIGMAVGTIGMAVGTIGMAVGTIGMAVGNPFVVAEYNPFVASAVYTTHCLCTTDVVGPACGGN